MEQKERPGKRIRDDLLRDIDSKFASLRALALEEDVIKLAWLLAILNKGWEELHAWVASEKRAAADLPKGAAETLLKSPEETLTALMDLLPYQTPDEQDKALLLLRRGVADAEETIKARRSVGQAMGVPGLLGVVDSICGPGVANRMFAGDREGALRKTADNINRLRETPLEEEEEKE